MSVLNFFFIYVFVYQNGLFARAGAILVKYQNVFCCWGKVSCCFKMSVCVTLVGKLIVYGGARYEK